ncbi:MAG: formyltetrahydrofolate deformylase [Yoonia sp.]|jgi:formyltetrahydrofolate deformylase
MSERWRLLIECADEEGLVHKTTGVLFRAKCNVMVNHEFADDQAGRFFMRTEFLGEIDRDQILADMAAVLPPNPRLKLVQPGRARIVVLGSKEHHCVTDILTRCAFSELDAEVVAVISNHDVLRVFVERADLPFHLVSHENVSREEQERGVSDLLEELDADYIVLAKYMRILSPEFVARFANRIINIHHSFLPAFIGARPYHQAWERGVKVIGATAHFVNEELDQGPIIEQQVITVDHSHGPEDMARAGRDVERLALSKAMRLVIEERVFLNGHRTVIFD